MFAAVRLVPSESLVSLQSPRLSSLKSQRARQQNVRAWLGLGKTQAPAPDLLLWGLTFGIMADFLDLVAPEDSLELWTHLWTYPTFSLLDVRLMIWALGYRFRAEKYQKMLQNPYADSEPIEVGLENESMPAIKSEVTSERSASPEKKSMRKGSRSSRVGFMLDGYYDIIRLAVRIVFIGRGVTTAAAIVWLWRKYRSGRS